MPEFEADFMIVPMAIHIKDWGMIPTPAGKAAIQYGGINDMAQANHLLAKSIHDGVVGMGSFLESQERIRRLGEESSLNDGLDAIAEECNEEVTAQGLVNDWAGAWSKAYAPRAKALLEEFPEKNRASHMSLAMRHSQRASAKAQSDFEKRQIQEAKDQWMSRMRHSSQQSNLDEQAELFSDGVGVFFPESEMEQGQRHLDSANKKNQWSRGFDADPLSTLALALQAKEEELPSENQHRQEFEAQLGQAQSRLKAQLTQSLMLSVMDGRPFDEAALRNSAKASLINEQAVESTLKEDVPPNPLSLCLWSKRMDECDYDDADKVVDLQLEMLTSSLSREEKSKLIARANEAMQVPFDKRCKVSRQAWALYSNGYLGAQNDRFTLARLNKIQSEGISALRKNPERGSETWSKQIGQNLDTWVCYNNH